MATLRPKLDHQSDVAEEAPMLDEVLQNIDEALPLIYRQCEVTPKPPTDRFSKQTLDVFREMCDDPLLNDEGDDICLCTKEQKKADGVCECPDHQHGMSE